MGLALAINVSEAGALPDRFRGRGLPRTLQRVDQAIDLLHWLTREDDEQSLDARRSAEGEHMSGRHGVNMAFLHAIIAVLYLRRRKQRRPVLAGSLMDDVKITGVVNFHTELDTVF